MRFEDFKVGEAYKVNHRQYVHTIVYKDNDLKQIVTHDGEDLEVWNETFFDGFEPLEESEYSRVLISEFKDTFKRFTNKDVEVIIKKK